MKLDEKSTLEDRLVYSDWLEDNGGDTQLCQLIQLDAFERLGYVLSSKQREDLHRLRGTVPWHAEEQQRRLEFVLVPWARYGSNVAIHGRPEDIKDIGDAIVKHHVQDVCELASPLHPGYSGLYSLRERISRDGGRLPLPTNEHNAVLPVRLEDGAWVVCTSMKVGNIDACLPIGRWSNWVDAAIGGLAYRGEQPNYFGIKLQLPGIPPAHWDISTIKIVLPD